MKYRNHRQVVRLPLAASFFALVSACVGSAEPDMAVTDPDMQEPADSGGAGGGEPNDEGTAGSGVNAGGRGGGVGGTGGINTSAAGKGGQPTVVPDAGVTDSGLADEGQAPGYVRAIMGVGYGGIRVLSRDNGLTWKKTAQLGARGGDDQNLLVSVAWGKGKWIATFTWKSWSSPDGFTWTQFDPGTGCRGLTRVAFGNGVFVGAACNPGGNTTSWASTDGVRWVKKGAIPSGFHTDLVFAPADGKFLAWGMDNHKAHTSIDGTTWTLLPGSSEPAVCDGLIKTQTACKRSFGGQGMWIRPDGSLLRSTDGMKFTKVYTDDSGNYVPGPFSMAWGWAPPP